MTEPLAKKYRPKKFQDMIGQSMTATILQKMVEKNSVPHAILLTGPSGIGKTTAARVLAAELNPTQADAIADGSSIDVMEVDSASNGGVADVRRMIETLRFSPSANAVRVVIYDEAHSITREGWNALLKPTEEGMGTLFIFVTTEPERIPDTVLSRLREFEFYRVSPHEIGARLAHIAKAEGIPLEGPLLGALAEGAGGNVRTAIEALDQVWNAEITTLAEYTELRGETDRSVELLRPMLAADFAAMSVELENQLTSTANPHRVLDNLVQTFSDLLVLRSGGKTSHIGAAEQVRKELTYLVDQTRAVQAMRIVWDLKTRFKSSSHAATDVRLAVTLIYEVMAAGRQAPQAAPAQPVPVQAPVSPPTAAPRKLSLSEMMKS